MRKILCYGDSCREYSADLASDIVEPSPVDDEHMTADGHRKLAQAIFDKIDEMIIV